MNLAVFLSLVAGHLIGDFLLQNRWVATRKKKISILILHVAIVTLVSYLWLGLWPLWVIPAVLFLTHFALDFVKNVFGNEGLAWFLGDQCLHLVVIFILARYEVHPMAMPYWAFVVPSFLKLTVVLIGVLLAVWFGGVLITKAVTPIIAEAFPDHGGGTPGLSNGGRLIGMLERALILLLVVAGQAAGVGWLFAAKSIFRFGEIKDSSQRKEAEYIIIGTLMSFGWALLVAFLTQYLLIQVPLSPWGTFRLQ